MALPTSVNGFTTIPVSYSPSSTHYIYARQHSGPKKETGAALPNGRTLFLVNVPPDATERELILLFKNAGTVEKVSFDLDVQEPQNDDDSDSEEEEGEEEEGSGVDDDLPRKKRKVSKVKPQIPKLIPLPSTNLRTLRRTGRSAHVVFLDSSSLDRALSGPHKPRPWPRSEEPTGLSHYTALYDSLRPPLDTVREHADSAIDVFEFELAKSKQNSKYRKGEAIVDDDGFTLVTRGGAYGQTLGGGVGVASKRFQQSGQTRHRNKKKEGKEKEGFYGFQKAEKQRSGKFCFQMRCPRD